MSNGMIDDDQEGKVPADIGALYAQYRAYIFTVAQRHAESAEEAEDVTQEAFLRAWCHRARIEPQGARKWLETTVRHLCCDRARRRQIIRFEPIEDVPLALLPADHETPERVAIASEDRRAIHRMLAALPAQQAEVLALFYGQDLSTEAIAALMGRTRVAIKSLLFRARRALADLAGADGLGWELAS